MSDPVGLISGAGGVGPTPKPAQPSAKGPVGGPSFREVLVENLEKVNEAQQEADRAVEDLVSGRRSDVEGVILATQKADNAFKMLQAVRGKVLQAYDEIKQIRV
ncbi:MAG: flagellar hook-basal body complex protein FliE [Planctomycetota bacterium]